MSLLLYIVVALCLITHSFSFGSDDSEAVYSKIQNQVYTIKTSFYAEAVHALRELVLTAIYQPHQKLVVKAGAVPVFISLLKSDSSTMKSIAAQAIGILASTEENQKLLAASGAIPPLSLLLQDESDETTLAAIQAMGNIAQCESLQEDIVKYGAIDSIVALLKSQAFNTRKVAAGVLGNLAIHVPNCMTIAQAGAIPLLVDLLSECTDLQTREVAVGALRNLAENKEVLDDLASDECIAVLAQELKSGTAESKELAVGLLQLIATTSKQSMHAVLSLGVDFPANNDEL